MGELRIDPRFVAIGFDQNRNGVVHDDLRIDVPGLASADGSVTVDQLAAALGRDSLVISGGAAARRQGPARYPELAESRTVRSIYNITVQSQWQNYNSVTTEAIASMRASLTAINEISNDNSDFRSRKVREIAQDALWRTSMSTTTDNLHILREALRHIQAIAEVPPQPSAVVKELSDAVAGNGAAIKTLGEQVRNPAAAGAVEKAKAKAAAERQAAEAVPGWQKWLIFGLFKKWGHEKAAKRIEENLAALQAADPAAREQKLGDLARQAYEISLEAEAVKNLDDSQKVGNDAKAVRKELDALRKDIDAQNKQIGDLLKKIAS
ncbi:MAG: hypothetical protein FJZ01_20280 [Candidatus Sericytochromatia bacterium]|nr:hypothetical protein [Candidatus Tanganyikabacteria bacterium]